MHIAIVFPNHRIIYINTHNACITYCYPCTYTEAIDIIIKLLYNLEGNHIQRNIPFKIDRNGPTKGRQDTEIENGIFPHIAGP